MVLLDHGLYDELKPIDRVNLSKFYKSIILRDTQKMIEHSNALGVKNHEVFSEILVQRPVRRRTFHLPSKMTEADIAYMRERAHKHFDQIMNVLKDMPRPMLLIIRNLNTVRAITRDHGHPVDRYSIMAHVAISGSYVGTESAGLWCRIRSWWELAIFKYYTEKEKWLLKFGLWYVRLLGVLGRAPDVRLIKDVIDDAKKRFDKI